MVIYVGTVQIQTTSKWFLLPCLQSEGSFGIVLCAPRQFLLHWTEH
ncbi:unnamed protein product [Ixodes pacificus]